MGKGFVHCEQSQHAAINRGIFDSLVNIGIGPVEELAGESVETCCGVFKICCFPDNTSIGPSKVHGSVAIVTIVIARKGDIVRIDEISFNFDLQCGIIRPSYKSQQCSTTLLPLGETYRGRRSPP